MKNATITTQSPHTHDTHATRENDARTQSNIDASTGTRLHTSIRRWLQEQIKILKYIIIIHLFGIKICPHDRCYAGIRPPVVLMTVLHGQPAVFEYVGVWGGWLVHALPRIHPPLAPRRLFAPPRILAVLQATPRAKFPLRLGWKPALTDFAEKMIDDGQD